MKKKQKQISIFYLALNSDKIQEPEDNKQEYPEWYLDFILKKEKGIRHGEKDKLL